MHYMARWKYSWIEDTLIKVPKKEQDWIGYQTSVLSFSWSAKGPPVPYPPSWEDTEPCLGRLEWDPSLCLSWSWCLILLLRGIDTKLFQIKITNLLDIRQVVLDLGLELAGGQEHLCWRSSVRDWTKEHLDKIRQLSRVYWGYWLVLSLTQSWKRISAG